MNATSIRPVTATPATAPIETAATAAVHAIDENVAVQHINEPKFRTRLESDRQVLVWASPAKP